MNILLYLYFFLHLLFRMNEVAIIVESERKLYMQYGSNVDHSRGWARAYFLAYRKECSKLIHYHGHRQNEKNTLDLRGAICNS